MNLKKLELLFIFFILFSISVYAQPPFQQAGGGELTLTIRNPLVEFVEQYKSGVKLHTHVYNTSNGQIMNNKSTDCYFHLYDTTGNHILREEMGFEIEDNSGGEFELSIGRNNFSKLGPHSLIIQCNTSTQGGFSSGGFTITEDGKDPSIIKDPYNLYIFIGYIFIVLVLILFMHKFKSDRGTAFVYGMMGATLSFIMVAMMAGGLTIVEGFIFFIDVNYYIMGLVLALGFYCAIISYIFFSDLKEDENTKSEMEKH